MFRRSLFTVALVILACPAIARAQVTFSVHQELGQLPTSLGPYFLVWTLNDLNPAVNSVSITNFSSTNLNFPATTQQFIFDPLDKYNAGGTVPVPTGAPGGANIVNPDFQYYSNYFVNNDTAFSNSSVGSVTTAGIGPGNPQQPTVFIFEGPASLGGVTSAWQQIVPTVQGQNASIDFTVTVSNFYDPNYAADTFTFNLAYTDQSLIGQPWQVGDVNYTLDVQTLDPTGKALVFAELTNTLNYTNVNASPIDTTGANAPNMLILTGAGLTAAVVTPEPGTMVIWGAVFGLSGLVYRRRKSAAVAAALPTV